MSKTIDDIREGFAEAHKDTKLNLSSLSRMTELSAAQLWGCALACALNMENTEFTQAVMAKAKQELSEAESSAAAGAASLMAMNNIYYRFLHMVDDSSFQSIPAKLRMNFMSNPGVDKALFELWSLAVSALNGCGMCIQSHTKHLMENGVSKESIAAAVKVAAILNAAQVAARDR